MLGPPLHATGDRLGSRTAAPRSRSGSRLGIEQPRGVSNATVVSFTGAAEGSRRDKY